MAAPTVHTRPAIAGLTWRIETMRDHLIDEYFEVVQSLTADDVAGERLARDLWRQMTAEQQAEVRRLHRQPCRGYDESCRPTKETR